MHPAGRTRSSIHPAQSWYDREWLSSDPCTDRDTDPLWYGDDIVDALRAAGPEQEIGCHSFSHALFDDPALTVEAVRSDLEACLALAARHGITPRSFVFPRNREGHHALLREYGFRAFRGADPTWHAEDFRAPPVASLTSSIRPSPSRPRFPRRTRSCRAFGTSPARCCSCTGPGSDGSFPWALASARRVAGLRRAIREDGVFHLWTHPFNLASDHEGMLATLDAILRDAVRLRDAGRLRIESMGQIADRMANP